MTYSQAIKHMQNLRMFGTKLGLENPSRLASLVESPHKQLRFIHVAGTNGKGSVCAMLESVYREAGYRTGLFTSPHLISFRERIQVNRNLIPETTVARLSSELVELMATFPKGQKPTFFEMAVVMALCHFSEQKCDVVLWETGMGGRLDATNIVTPIASVITNIGLDHTRWLGDSHTEIAQEKSGIIKHGIPAFTATQQHEALSTIRSVAKTKKAELIEIDKSNIDFKLSLLGQHQQTNARLVYNVVNRLKSILPVSTEHIKSGLKTVSWAGRLQLVNIGLQKFLLDGAHNAEGALTLQRSLKDHFNKKSLVFILGMVNEKDGSGFCQNIAPIADRIILSPVKSDRSANPSTFEPVCQTANPKAKTLVVASLRQALEQCEKEHFVIITGSFYLVGEALEQLGIAPQAIKSERLLNDWGAPSGVNENNFHT